MPRTADRQRATAARNVEAILDAAEALLQEGAAATIAAVAARSGLSRVTVYAHFATREDLLEAVVRRAANHSRAALEAAAVGDSAAARLHGVVSAAWTVVQRHDAVARAAARELPSSTRSRAHADVHGYVAGLVREAQAEGGVRADLSAEWLARVVVALVHAAAEQVQEGGLAEADARAALTATVDAALSG